MVGFSNSSISPQRNNQLMSQAIHSLNSSNEEVQQIHSLLGGLMQRAERLVGKAYSAYGENSNLGKLLQSVVNNLAVCLFSVEFLTQKVKQLTAYASAIPQLNMASLSGVVMLQIAQTVIDEINDIKGIYLGPVSHGVDVINQSDQILNGSNHSALPYNMPRLN